jgi:mRNA interferase MazF
MRPPWFAFGTVLLTAKLTGLDRDSVANVSHLVTVDKRQLTERVGKIPNRQMEGIFSGIDRIMDR